MMMMMMSHQVAHSVNVSHSSCSRDMTHHYVTVCQLQALQQAHGRARSQRVNQQRPAASTLASVESRQRAVKRRRQRYSDESSRGPHTAFNSDTQRHRHRPSATNTHSQSLTRSLAHLPQTTRLSFIHLMFFHLSVCLLAGAVD